MADQTCVGTRPEEVASNLATKSGDWPRLALLFVIAIAVHTWLFFHTYTTARDSIGFAQLALQYESPREAHTQYPCQTPLDVLKHGLPPHPPGYPLAVLATSKVVRKVYTADLADQMLCSTQIASIIAAVLLIFPSYAIGRMLFSRFCGFVAASLFQVLPVAARTTSDGLTEAWYLLFVATSLAFGIRAVRSLNTMSFFYCGLACGAAYLVRPEGLLVAVTMTLVIGITVLRQLWSWIDGFNRLLALGVGTMMLALPYMATIGAVTLKPSGKMWIEAPESDAALGNPLPDLNPQAKPGIGFPKFTLFAAIYDAESSGPKALWVPMVLFKEASKAFHYGSMVFAILGVIFVVRSLRSDPAICIPIVMGILNILVIEKLAYSKGYLSERHTLPIVFLGCFFAAYACQQLPGFIAQLPVIGSLVLYRVGLMWIFYGILFLSCLPATGRPLHENRNGHKAIGEYLKIHAQDDDVILDPYNWAQYYSGRSLRGVPPDPNPARVRWAILEEGEEPHSTLTRLKPAMAVKNDKDNPPQLIAFPDTSDKRGARSIILYRQVVK